MYRQQRNYENANKKIFEGIGEYQVPKIEATQYDFCEFVGFNAAKAQKDRENKGIHFFLDDYQFCRLWNYPDKYIDLLSTFKYVLSSDFSLYTDFPKALQIYNHYRKHWLAAYWQECGINVIPTICWSDQQSFAWCFDGEPIGGAVAVSSVGTQNSRKRKEIFLEGYDKMLEILKPDKIIFYGNVPEECEGNIIQIKSFSEKFREMEK